MAVRIHILSDLHLEFGPFAPPEVNADLVVLAGDTHVGVKGVRWAKEAFPGLPVVYVVGNHEYYRHSYPTLTEKLRAEAAGSNVQVLERDVLEIHGVAVYGCTLWTDLALNGDALLGGIAAAELMSDYRLIRVAPHYRRLRPGDTEMIHRRSVRWLREETKRREGPRVVVTHHAPSSESLDPVFRRHRVNAAYASNLEDLVRELEPSLWIHGHTHRPCDYTLGRTRVVCNPRGYPDENSGRFDPALVVEVQSP